MGQWQDISYASRRIMDPRVRGGPRPRRGPCVRTRHRACLFSAWHYSTGSSEAHLWASLMSNIFTTLHPSQSEREGKIARLLEEADIAQQIRDDSTLGC